jgi:hypothetical protein
MEKNSFGLLELEMADLERFWRKTPLGPLGVKVGDNYRILKLPCWKSTSKIFSSAFHGI